MKKLFFGSTAFVGIVLGFWVLAMLRAGTVNLLPYLPVCIYLFVSGIASMFIYGRLVDGK